MKIILWHGYAINSLANEESAYFDEYYGRTNIDQEGMVWQDDLANQIVRGPDIAFILDNATAPSGRVLDLGCGTGWLSEKLAKRGLSVDGIDISPKAIEIAECRVRNALAGSASANFWVSDLDNCNLLPNTYTAIVAWDTLHHIIELDHLFEEISKSLKQDGVFCGFEHSGADTRNRILIIVASTLVAIVNVMLDRERFIYQVRVVKKRLRQQTEPPSPRERYIESLRLDMFGKISSGLAARFAIKSLNTSDSFVGSIAAFVGGPMQFRHRVIRVLKRLDNFMIKKGLLRGMHIRFIVKNKT